MLDVPRQRGSAVAGVVFQAAGEGEPRRAGPQGNRGPHLPPHHVVRPGRHGARTRGGDVRGRGGTSRAVRGTAGAVPADRAPAMPRTASTPTASTPPPATHRTGKHPPALRLRHADAGRNAIRRWCAMRRVSTDPATRRERSWTSAIIRGWSRSPPRGRSVASCTKPPIGTRCSATSMRSRRSRAGAFRLALPPRDRARGGRRWRLSARLDVPLAGGRDGHRVIGSGDWRRRQHVL